MADNALRDKIDNLIATELSSQKPVDRKLIDSAIDTILGIVPKRNLEAPYRTFIKSGIQDEKDELEIALLTRDLWLYDLTSTLEERSTIATRIGPSTYIQLMKYHTLESEQAAQGNDEPPYRATLTIYGPTEGSLIYTAEGNRRLVEKLISFSEVCMQLATRSRP